MDWFNLVEIKIYNTDIKQLKDEKNNLLYEVERLGESNEFLVGKWEDIQEENEEIKEAFNFVVTQRDKLVDELEALKKSIEDKPNPLEDYWNNKIKPSVVKYKARRNDNKEIDVRTFLTTNNDLTPTVTETTNDKKAIASMKYVKNKITYTQRLDKENNGEFWQYANETMKTKDGDCEDGAILMANIMIKSGVPYWRVRVNAGSVNGGGHAYVTYLRESDNKWIVLDWCYWYDSKGILWTTAKNYFGIWFSFNNKYAFKKPVLDRKEE